MFWGMCEVHFQRGCTLPKPGAELSLGDLHTRCPCLCQSWAALPGKIKWSHNEA